MLSFINLQRHPELLALLEQLPIPLWIIDSNANHLKWVNQSALSFAQCQTLAELQQKNWQSLLDLTPNHSFSTTLPKNMLNSPFSPFYSQIELENGQLGFLIQGYPISLESNSAELVEQAKLWQMLDQIPCIIFTAINDGNWSIDFMSEGCFILTGYHSYELTLLGKNLDTNSITHPDDLPKVIQTINKAIAQQQPYEVEYRIRTKSGQEKWFLEKGNGIDNGLGEIKKIEGYIIDITHLKQVEQALQEREGFYRILAENATDLITLQTTKGTLCYISPISQFLLGYSPEILQASSVYELCHREDQPRLRQFYNQLTLNSSINSIMYRMRHCQGHYLWFETNAKVIPKSHLQETAEIICISRNITKRKQAEEALQQAEYQYRNIFNNITQGIFQTAKDGHYLTANPALAKLLGYESPADLINHLVYVDHQLYVDPNCRESLIQQLEEQGSVTNFESQVYRKDGSIIWICENTHSVYDHRGNFLYYEGTVEDITYRRQAAAQLFHSTFHDPLTELPNRSWFMNELEKMIHQISAYSNQMYGVLFIDLDGFKRINESLGHGVGDELLKLVSHRLKATVRESDKIARFSGDKFVILLSDGIENIEEITIITERILQRFKIPFKLCQETLFIGVSIGITNSTIGYQKPEEVLRDAEVAMYQAKASGKDCYVVFDKIMRQSALSRLQLESDLRKAIKKQEFLLYYQPIIELKQGKLIGFEALIRWQHPHKGWISPVDFIPIAEETGLINAIGWWVMEEACSQLQQWQNDYPQAFPLEMNINFSMYQLSQKNLVQKIKNILEQTGVNSQSIKLEITESCFLETIASEIETLQQIKNLGIGLCIDDFGTGYSSLNRLHQFPIDTLKIDRSFIQRLQVNQTAIISIILTLAHTLGMNVVAEGIETLEQLKQLQNLDCESGQGYLFSPPVEGETACQFLQKFAQIQQYFS